ncbi:MAG TPA: hypothetical protein PK239_10715 [Chitinophagales bacterium]|nr:hypothetical protein [Chitinophagales bacterium]HRK27738.1 hypothetical protein [Chitinophagales bacterium]
MLPLLPILCYLVCFILVNHPAHATQWHVGPTRTYTLPSQVAALVNHGDTVNIDAAVYTGNVAVWVKNNLLLRGWGGLATLNANGNSAENKAIWVLKGANTTVENIAFTGCTVPDLNGAGIRQEGAGLTLRHCYFHHNQMGILAGANAASNILIEHCEFAYHGEGAGGYSHNVYINQVNSLTFRYNYSHHSITGHTLKSRAYNNYIYYNRIGDEADGTSSYNIDLPNGGKSYLIGNTVQQAPTSPNSGIISYGAEGLSNPVNELYMAHNTVVNNKANGTFVFAASGSTQVQLVNNLFAGNGVTLNGTATLNTGNVSSTNPAFVNGALYDYRLTAASPAINAGVPLASIGEIPLSPMFQYQHHRHALPRQTEALPDAGAYEYLSGSSCTPQRSLRFYGNGTGDIDRVKFNINPPAPTPADVGANFTLEFWIKTTHTNNNGFVQAQTNGDGWITGNVVVDRDIYGSGDYGDYGIAIGSSSTTTPNQRVVAFGVDRLGIGTTIVGTTNIANNQWNHIAVTRNATTGLMRIFVNGTQDAQGTGPTGDLSYRNNRSTSFPLSDPFLVIGAEKHDAGPEYPSYNGFFDEFRISDNIRYTANFTTPTMPFMPDANTVLLCHFDEGSGAVVNDSSGAAALPTNGFINTGGSPAGPVWSTDTPFIITLSPQITASLPQPCLGETVTYSVTPLPGSSYLWTITGSYTLLAGGATTDASVTLQWNSSSGAMVSMVQTIE